MTDKENLSEEKIKPKKINKKCKLVVKGKSEPCGKVICYKNDMRGRHQFWSDKRTTIPKACKVCGKAVLVDYQLCLDCGGSKINYKLKSQK